jgi:uncharacterized protein (TIGR02099 family)
MQKPPRKRDSLVLGLKRLMGVAVQARSTVHRWRQRLPAPVKRLLRGTTHVTLHSVLGVFIAVVLIFVLARLWLPTLTERKSEIENYLTSTAGSQVRFDTLDTYWDGLNPGVHVRGFQIGPAAPGQPVIRLKEVRLSLAWLPLLTGRIEINSLTLVEPRLAVERGPDGALHISGLETADQPEQSEQGVVVWLLRQHEMIIENGQLVWIDRMPVAGRELGKDLERVVVKRVNITLRNDGNRHQLEARADFPRQLCADCRVSADVTGQPFESTDWDGEIALLARDLSLAELPRILRTAVPAALQGHFNLKIVSRWRAGRPAKIEGRAAVKALTLPLPGEPAALSIPAVDTAFVWAGKTDNWHLDLQRLQLALTGPAWNAGRLQLTRHGDDTTLSVDHVDVADLGTFVARLPHEGPVFDWLRTARPGGNLEHVRVEFSNPADAAADYSVEADLRGVRFAPHERIPGVQGLSGRLKASRDGGEFRLASAASRVLLPRVFRDPLDLLSMSTRVSWRQNSENWLVRAEDIALAASDGEVRGSAELRLPKDPQLSPVLDLRAEVVRAVGTHAARYFPLILPEGLRAYLEHALVDGRATKGSVVFHGALREFPFRDGKGQFEVRVHVKDGVFAYLPGWSPARDVDADLDFTSRGMMITARAGRVRGLQAGRVVVAIDDFLAPGGAVVRVSGRFAGPVQDAVNVLADSKSEAFVPYLVPGLRAEGDGVLSLELAVPAHEPKTFTLNGDYQLRNAGLGIPFRNIRLESLRGGIQFTESGLHSGKMSARLLGGETEFRATPGQNKEGGTLIQAHGTITPAGLSQLVGAGLAARFEGDVPWRAHTRLGNKNSEVVAESDLTGLEIHLPAPLAKTRGEALTLAVRTSRPRPDRQVLDLQAGGRLSGKLELARGRTGWEFVRGHIGVGERISALPAQSGLVLSTSLPALNVDPWWQLLNENLDQGGDNGWLTLVSHVTAEVDALEAFNRPLGHLRLDLDKSTNSWRGRLSGDAITGQVLLIPPCGARMPCAQVRDIASGESRAADRLAVHLALTKLVLPAPRPGAPETTTNPGELPLLHIRSDAFTALGHDLGALEFRAEPVSHGWRITTLKLTHPDAVLSLNGLWATDTNGRQSTSVDGTLTSANFGRVLDAFGYPGEMVGGRLHLTSQLSWPGAPGAFTLARANGNLALSLANGRLLKISPGAGRLLGVLDLRSAARYLTLDFSNLFGKGLVFDSMKGQFVIQQGDAYTRALVIHASGADIDLSGRIGFALRDLDLEIGVTPRLTTELAVTGGLIGGPAVGAAVAVLHSLIRKPFEKGTRASYTVKGSWEEPVVTRVSGSPAETAPPEIP